MEKEEGEERGGGRQALAKTCSRFLKPRQKNMFDKKNKKNVLLVFAEAYRERTSLSLQLNFQFFFSVWSETIWKIISIH